MTWFLPPTYQTRKLHSSYPSHAPTPSNLLKLVDVISKLGASFCVFPQINTLSHDFLTLCVPSSTSLPWSEQANTQLGLRKATSGFHLST